jgi:hypothetical protein
MISIYYFTHIWQTIYHVFTNPNNTLNIRYLNIIFTKYRMAYQRQPYHNEVVFYQKRRDFSLIGRRKAKLNKKSPSETGTFTKAKY